MNYPLDIKASNGVEGNITIRTATGEVGIVTLDSAIYVRAADVDALCEALQRAAASERESAKEEAGLAAWRSEK
jgi:hypothetical protein